MTDFVEGLTRLSEVNINLIPAELDGFFLFERDGFAALVERKEESFGSVGAAGLLTPEGLAMLVWKRQKAHFVAKGLEQEASDEQIACLRSFSHDLESALSRP